MIVARALLCLVLVVTTGAQPLPCDQKNGRFRNAPFCDISLPIPDRVKDYISHISQEDKLGQFVDSAKNMPSVDMPSYQWWSEALHGVAGSPGVSFGGSFKYATSFPQVCLTASSFNRTLYNTIGQVISTEARAFHNHNRAGLTFWTPNINIFRDPRWGRGQETPGEDPYLTAEYVSVYVQGLQTDPQFPSRLKVSSCCKHYTAYDLENWHGVDRDHFNAIVTAQDLADTIQPPFQACVQRGKVSGLMCSYNAVNGVPSCANKALLNDVVRAQWGFEGYVTSDCGAVYDVMDAHNYTHTTDDTIKAVLRAGMDNNCGEFLSKFIPQAVADGAITQDDVDTALTNLFKVQFRLGMFDPPTSLPWSIYDSSNVNTPASQQLALEAAEQGIVLLKNNNALPIDPNSGATFAVLGPNGNVTDVMQGNYYGDAPYLISPLMGLQQRGFAATYLKGCDMDSNNTQGFAAAQALASKSDYVILVVGLDQSQEREGQDRTDLLWPGVQKQFISSVAGLAKKKTIVVIMSGGPIDISDIKSSAAVDAILWAGYPGQSGGTALAKILAGDVNPSGRLVHTVYSADYVNEVSMFDMNFRPGKNNPGRTHRFYTGNAVYKFGSGLSYSQWEVTPNATVNEVHSKTIAQLLTANEVAPHLGPDVLNLTIYLTNKGPYDGSFTALLMNIPPNAGHNGVPLQQLVGFNKVFAKVGQTVPLNFGIKAHQLAIVGEDGNTNAAPGVWKFRVVDDGKDETEIRVI